MKAKAKVYLQGAKVHFNPGNWGQLHVGGVELKHIRVPRAVEAYPSTPSPHTCSVQWISAARSVGHQRKAKESKINTVKTCEHEKIKQAEMTSGLLPPGGRDKIHFHPVIVKHDDYQFECDIYSRVAGKLSVLQLKGIQYIIQPLPLPDSDSSVDISSRGFRLGSVIRKLMCYHDLHWQKRKRKESGE